MKNKKLLEKYVNTRYFEFPNGMLKNFFISKRLCLFEEQIINATPCIYLYNRTTKFDKELISNFAKNSFVFLKDEYIFKINHGLLEKNEEKDLKEQIKILKDFYVSIFIFSSNTYPAFGETAEVSKNLCDFIINANYNLKFLSLTETFFSMPIWSDSFLMANTKYSQKFSFTISQLKSLKENEIYDFFNKKMPSSASTYAKHNEILMHANKRATGLSRIVYACPNCNSLFSVYDEFNCLKCANCGTAIEVQQNGQIGQSKTVSSFDDLKEFQIKLISNTDFKNKEILSYNLELMKMTKKRKIKPICESQIKIFKDKLEIKNENYNQIFKYKDVIESTLLWNNNLLLNFPNINLILHGKNNENLYVIIDLIKLSKKEH